MPEPGDQVFTREDVTLTEALRGARITKICWGWHNNDHLVVIETDHQGSEPGSIFVLSFIGTCAVELHDAQVENLVPAEGDACHLPI